MERLKMETIGKLYPNKCLVLHAEQRNEAGMVEYANVLGAFDTKEEAVVEQTVLKMLDIDTFIVPLFKDEEKQLDFSAAESAKMLREYFGTN